MIIYCFQTSTTHRIRARPEKPMQKIFSNILVPLSLDKRTAETMRRSIDMALRLQCHVHFLFNLRGGLSWAPIRKARAERKKIFELKELSAKTVGRDIQL